ncbi:MAG TPA: DNA alkylation repair protein [Candidatus Limnocylindrales bacterium]|nr:DNA alkylation repair protein [Candidatus Limnocylindrales bacterium]
MLNRARAKLREHSDPERAKAQQWFFKNCDSDKFLGVTVPQVRRVAAEFGDMPLPEVVELMRSRVHEERSLAHAILRSQMERADERGQSAIYGLYMKNRSAIHDWDGVDDSAPYIVGRHLLNRDKSVLYRMIRARSIWDRRIALVATLWFIRNGNVADTLALCEEVLGDKEDLIHKASGWMLREAGKRDAAALKHFLDAHAAVMPRTMLRYAIERFAEPERRHYMEARKREAGTG